MRFQVALDGRQAAGPRIGPLRKAERLPLLLPCLLVELVPSCVALRCDLGRRLQELQSRLVQATVLQFVALSEVAALLLCEPRSVSLRSSSALQAAATAARSVPESFKPDSGSNQPAYKHESGAAPGSSAQTSASHLGMCPPQVSPSLSRPLAVLLAQRGPPPCATQKSDPSRADVVQPSRLHGFPPSGALHRLRLVLVHLASSSQLVAVSLPTFAHEIAERTSRAISIHPVATLK